MLFTSQQFRALYLELCFAAEKQLTASEFITAAATQNVFLSALTASIITNDNSVLTEVSPATEDIRELVGA